MYKPTEKDIQHHIEIVKIACGETITREKAIEELLKYPQFRKNWWNEWGQSLFIKWTPGYWKGLLELNERDRIFKYYFGFTPWQHGRIFLKRKQISEIIRGAMVKLEMQEGMDSHSVREFWFPQKKKK